MRGHRHIRWIVGLAAVGGIVCVALTPALVTGPLDAPAAAQSRETGKDWKLDARRAYGYLEKVCKIGPRPSGSQGMQKQQQLIADHFTQLGAKVKYQPFDAVHPVRGTPVRMKNIIVSWHPEAKRRILLVCHYDTRPYPDRDRRNPRGKFVGANDGGSGVALFMEMAHHMKKLKGPYGVDFLLVDGEEFVFRERDEYFLGSTYFAEQYKQKPPEYRYVAGVVVDMVADKRLALFFEENSMTMAPQVTRAVWATARRMGVREFVPRVRHEVRDDHLPLNQIARIPTCDIIDFDYPYWHTTRDTPAACSGSSLATVGRVLLSWLESPGLKP
jgi:hypothetical protein